ncbi:unnamed protein product [Didymodactylos carnosus]|uniref:Uncharacterized protein n=1 Tax=Didymodactylos carnosus TaxID=1234261 RepID=A0A815HD48_9BILA|nr:unnamed protein product [Didymodactylos carnosus]CAF4220393.1 unnamed protein product [Didymodactylos carnosus]
MQVISLNLETDGCHTRTEPIPQSPAPASSSMKDELNEREVQLVTSTNQTKTDAKSGEVIETKEENDGVQVSEPTITFVAEDHIQHFPGIVPDTLPKSSIEIDENSIELRYDKSITGSILLPSHDKNSIFTYAEHGNFPAFIRVLEIHHAEVVLMRNDRNQVSINILPIQKNNIYGAQQVKLKTKVTQKDREFSVLLNEP